MLSADFAENSGNGGGVFNSGTANLNNCTISGNIALGLMAITSDSVVYVDVLGGGLFNEGTATLTNCTVSGNGAIASYWHSGNGGGVFNSGIATLTNCTLSGNTAYSDSAGAAGGGSFNSATATLTNCTLSGNSAFNESGSGSGSGGGVFNSGMATIANCTISRNGLDQSYANGGGVGLYNTGTATLTNTIVAGQINCADIVGTITGSHNLIGDGSGGLADSIIGDPMVADLTDNGGPTQTMALLPGSPAIDAGTATGAPSTDQRGFGRVGAVDIGAFELQAHDHQPLRLQLHHPRR